MNALIVDGYNVIHAWPELRVVLTKRGLADARALLVAELGEYAAVRDAAVTVVFDSTRRGDHATPPEEIDRVTVVFSGRGGDSADHVIERLAFEMAARGGASDVLVATDDRLQRSLVSAMGVRSIGVDSLRALVAGVRAEIAERGRRGLDELPRRPRVEDSLHRDVRGRLERLRRGEEE